MCAFSFFFLQHISRHPSLPLWVGGLLSLAAALDPFFILVLRHEVSSSIRIERARRRVGTPNPSLVFSKTERPTAVHEYGEVYWRLFFYMAR